MAFSKKKTEEKPEKVVEEKSTSSVVVADAPLCACGEPVASELGQNQVCVKHMKSQ